jgi:hypothetical protein
LLDGFQPVGMGGRAQHNQQGGGNGGAGAGAAGAECGLVHLHTLHEAAGAGEATRD